MIVDVHKEVETARQKLAHVQRELELIGNGALVHKLMNISQVLEHVKLSLSEIEYKCNCTDDE